MKKTLLCTSLVFLTAFPLSANSPWNETRKVIYTPQDGAKSYLIHPGQSLSQQVNFQLKDVPARRFLRVVGGIKLPAPFTQRGETLFRAAEFLIDDNLDSICTKKDRYSLYFKGDNDNFERLAFHRIPGKLLKQGELTVTLPVVKKDSLVIDPKGEFGLEIGLYFDKAGRAANDIYDEPDSVLYIPVPAGNSRSQKLTRTFTLPDNVACALLQLGGTHFSGECWLEAPCLRQQHKDVCSIPFTKFEERADTINYWVGSNLSTHSWPKWKLEAGGKTVFEGNVFDRASNVADFYIPLPEWLSDESELSLHLMKEGPRAAFPYEVHRLELIEETARPFEVISVPRFVAQHAAFGVLVETNEPNVTMEISSSDEDCKTMQKCSFADTGLHVVELRAGKAGQAIQLTFNDGKRMEQARVEQVIAKDPEQIYVSSGDEIYIDKAYSPYNYFFKWYFHNRVGNWYQFRPSYQWSGFRVANPEIICHYTQLLEQMKVPYAWQVEGRTLAAGNINPSLDVLSSPMFRGKQAHENDGGYYYWGHFKYEGLFSDLSARVRPYGGIFAKHRPIVTDHGTFVHYDTAGIKDMADGARTFVANLQYSKGESTRHTGPSSLFRYFYQAGYSWLGAEQMYGPETTILSSLRGASRAYSRPEYGTLHAMQWGSGPFSDPKHSLRTYMSLALAYMHGSSHMNTEEALWTDEYANDRYSDGGKEHMFAQHQVLDFVETHTRRGVLRSNIAIIQGRNDAWKSFVRGNLWSQAAEQWKFDKANESFDLLHVFYPHDLLDACGPHGWFTETPYGTVDLLPIEASREVMKQYKAMIFLGWNSFDAADFERLYDYVYQGGTVMLTAAHLNEEGLPNVPTRFPEKDDAVKRLLGDNYRSLTDKTEILLGNGKIIYYPQPLYPADDAIRNDYEATMYQLANTVVSGESERGWITDNPSVGFTVWDKETTYPNRLMMKNGKHCNEAYEEVEGNRRTIYLLNMDWKSMQKSTDSKIHETHFGTQPVSFEYGTRKFSVEVRRYHIETIHCACGLAVLPSANTTDVLHIQHTPTGWQVTVQTIGPDHFRCMQKDDGKDTVVSIDKAGITTFFIED